MRLHEFHQTQILPISIEAAWAFFSQPANLNEITPPAMRFETLGGDFSPVYPGQMLWYRLKMAPFIHGTWVTEITHVDPGVSFVDEQRAGPYKLWHHRHTFCSAANGGTEVKDDLIYALPFWPFGEIAHALYVRPMLKKVFSYRRQELARRFAA